MKKIFTLLTGILFLLMILSTGGCKSSDNCDTPRGPKKITIKIKSVRINDEYHLKMSDHKHKNVIDTLTTDVIPGDTVIWVLKKYSGIDNIESIYAADTMRIPNIFRKNPSINTDGVFELAVPADAVQGVEKEKYAIHYTLKNKAKKTIDPYIRIED